MFPIFRNPVAIVALLILVGCQGSPEPLGVESDVPWSDFEEALFAADTSQWQVASAQLKTQYAPFWMGTTDQFWLLQRRDSLLNALHQTPSPENWGAAIAQTRTMVASLAVHLNQPPPHLYTYLSRLDLEYPVIAADSLLFVARDAYLGAKSPWYSRLYAYQADQHRPEFLAGNAAEALLREKVQAHPSEQSFLNKMLYWGRLHYAKHMAHPQLPEAWLMGYTLEQWQFCEENTVPMWTYFVENKLLFSSEGDLERRFLTPAPFSKFYLPFDRQTPPRVGQWLGYQIVKSYVKRHPETTLQELLALSDAQQLFRESGFKPTP
jgi:hypothetical protein